MSRIFEALEKSRSTFHGDSHKKPFWPWDMDVAKFTDETALSAVLKAQAEPPQNCSGVWPGDVAKSLAPTLAEQTSPR